MLYKSTFERLGELNHSPPLSVGDAEGDSEGVGSGVGSGDALGEGDGVTGAGMVSCTTLLVSLVPSVYTTVIANQYDWPA